MKLPCACCEGVEATTPLATANRPGLSALSYRAGTYATFFDSMQARLSSHDYPELARLATREPSDPAIALLDAWAAVGEVLTFYQERIANEGYLRTATERRSVLELARLVGYRLRPGVAASVYLAYSIEKDAAPAEIPKGARVNSVPAAPGEQMQSFETAEALTARYEWNQLKPRMTEPQSADNIRSANRVYLAGTASGLKPNDVLLIQLDGVDPQPFRTVGVFPDDEAKRTLLTVAPIALAAPALTQPEARALVARIANHFIEAAPAPPSDAALTAQALKLLKSLAEPASARKSAARLIADGMPGLDKLHKSAQVEGFAPLVSWLAGIKAALAEVQDRVETTAPLAPEEPAPEPERPAARAPDAASVNRERGARFNEFSQFLEVLEAPPSIPPASSRRLARNSGQVFAEDADIYPRLLAALVPRVGPLLYAGLRTRVAGAQPVSVVALRKAVPMFGHNAPLRQTALEAGVPKYGEWPLGIRDRTIVDLDAAYDQILAGGFALVERKGVPPVLARIKSAQPVSVSKYGISGRVTELTLDQEWLNSQTEDTRTLEVLREATVHVQGEVLALAEEPVTAAVGGNDLELDALYEGLESGRWLIISGERVPKGSDAVVAGTELLMLAAVKDLTSSDGKPRTVITLAMEDGASLAYEYRRASVTIYGNVVHATHGETRNEVLGGGNAATPLQSFVLKQPPLTYVSAPSVSGVASTLEVRVNEVLWHEADNVAQMGPDDRGYSTSTGDDGKTQVIFGNGVHGARLPTGAENIRARYRNGIGQPGNVRPGQISLLATRPLGVKAVTNPIGGSGGADRESRDQARANAPLAVTALDRLVSTRDYADFARLFAGIGKASAARLSLHGRQTVCVTIAGAADIPIEKTSDLYRNLSAALRRYGDPFLPVQVELRELAALVIGASVKVLPDYDWEFVEPKVRATLLDVFGFERRELGQGVASSEVIAAIARVPGVAWVDLFQLKAVDRALAVAGFVGLDQQVGVPGRVESVVDGDILQAQLVYLQPNVRDTLILNEAKS